ncbi:aminopeptidase [Blautia sp. MSJ-9]|uniref:aminopeptidase n=1 Tax=Blautia sp. MSJ-9 TaxID=2841511 RepID=UPI00209EFDB5|nr:aminopeptidase [Blautia sp. MSJ-9]
MMNLETFLLLLMIVSVLTGLVTEGIKKLLDEGEKVYHPTLLAGVIAVVLSVAVGAGYIILTEAAINGKMAVILIALVLLSWLSATVGYDKVIQSIGQIKFPDKDE